jgi:Tetratricopeptide repeat
MYREAININPEYVEAWYNLGLLYQEQCKIEPSMQAYDNALKFNPEHIKSKWNLASAFLLQGNFERGWDAYEYRWRLHTPPSSTQPLWNGEPLQGKAILLHVEQGHGDTLQFVRYTKMLKQQGAKVILVCPKNLIPLLTTCGSIDQFVSEGDVLPQFDYHLSLLSLPRVFKTRENSIPNAVPYLAADAARIEKWSKLLQNEPGIRIGISWQGSVNDPLDSLERPPRKRSFPLAEFERLARIPHVKLYSLQFGEGSEQLENVKFPVQGFNDLDKDGAYLDTVAIMKSLHLVISVDSSLVHAAGATTVPVWVPLPYSPDWRWLLNREDTPWYPTMRLFRQPAPGDWKTPFANMAKIIEMNIQRQMAGGAARPS